MKWSWIIVSGLFILALWAGQESGRYKEQREVLKADVLEMPYCVVNLMEEKRCYKLVEVEIDKD